jgi:hypothetical protein
MNPIIEYFRKYVLRTARLEEKKQRNTVYQQLHTRYLLMKVIVVYILLR